MVLVSSRFRVTSEAEEATVYGFLHPLHTIDAADGFLGLEVFRDPDDRFLISLLTCWRDADSFRAWHGRTPHPESTALTIMEPVQGGRPNLIGNNATHHLVAGLDGTIRTCSTTVCKFLRASQEELLGSILWNWLVDADAASLRRKIGRRTTVPDEPFLLNFVGSDQAPYTLRCTLTTGPDSFILIGEPPPEDRKLETEWIELNNQLTVLSRENARRGREIAAALAELKETQSLLVHNEKMVSLGQMTAGIAHEINNPLAFVMNNATILRRDFDDVMGLLELVKELLPALSKAAPDTSAAITNKMAEVELDYLSTSIPAKLSASIDGLERLAEIVRDLRAYSRRDEAAIQDCDPTQGIAASLRFLKPLLDSTGVIIETDFGPSRTVRCNPGALNQAVSNIVMNAVQASTRGQSVTVRTQAAAEQYLITVEDHGSGIPPEILPKVFDPFFTTKPVGGGTGLGMSIALRAVKAGGGDIQITSDPGKGTTVFIRIPIDPGQHAAPPEPQ